MKIEFAKQIPVTSEPISAYTLENTVLARDFAVAHHGTQQYGNRPYIDHLEEVVKILDESGYPELSDAGFLHDILEDTDVTSEMLVQHFGQMTADTVALCTDEQGENRRIRKAATYLKVEKLRGESENESTLAGLAVKVADRVANIRNCVAEGNQGLLSMYRKEHRDFERVYYDARHQSLWDLYDEAIAG